jgi:tRNA(fMet)-specific endonuclease VapC
LAVLLDTDHFSILQRNERPATAFLQVRLEQLKGDEIQVSIISFQEQAQGWLAYIRRARKPEQILKGFSDLHDMLRNYSTREILPFDEPAMEEFLRLQKQRIRIGTSDLRIAAIAKANGVTLLSRNLRDFRQVPGLDVEDWTA